MEKKKNFFTKSLLPHLAVSLCVILHAVPVRAAGNGCDDTETNDRIVAELALCSTHAYNVGLDRNPDNISDKQLIKEVVALKTTVMTQQMNKQYEYLDAMLRRFKTQLEKAILTTKLQAAGATPAGTGTSGSDGGTLSGTTTTSGGGRPTAPYISGAQDCNTKYETTELYKCLAANWQEIQSQSNNGQNLTIELRRQLAYDYNLMDRNKQSGAEIKPEATMCSESRLSNRTQFTACLSGHITNIRKNTDLYNNANTRPGNNS